MRTKLKESKPVHGPPARIKDGNGVGGSPESMGYADNRSASKTEKAYQLMMNGSATKTLATVGEEVVQKISYEGLEEHEQMLLRTRIGSKGWTEEAVLELVAWSKSMNQIKSVISKMSYKQWQQIQLIYSAGSELNTKVEIPKEELHPDKKVNGRDRTIPGLTRLLGYWEKKANPVSTSMSLKALIEYQKGYERLLLKLAKGDKEHIMDTHRTFGIELEFAHYGGNKENPHTILAKSAESILTIAPGEWVLETDDSNKLEIGAPPFLIKDTPAKGLNIPVIKAIRAIVKGALQRKRDAFKPGDKIDKFIQGMPDEGLGEQWKFENPLATTMAFRGAIEKSDQERFKNPPKQDFLGLDYDHHKIDKYEERSRMYEQNNITLTPEEIAINFGHQKEHESSAPLNKHHGWIKTLNGTIESYLSRFLQGSDLAHARALLAKGLAGIAALPSITANTGSGVFSSVKEVYGIWVKDNTPNLVVTAVPEKESAIEAISSFTSSRKRRKKPVKVRQHTNAIAQLIFAAIKENEDEFVAVDYSKISHEVAKTLARINTNIASGDLIENKSRSTYDTKESFEGAHAGLGVRKDTFLNVTSGKTRNLHLAEIRSDWTLDRFMTDNE